MNFNVTSVLSLVVSGATLCLTSPILHAYWLGPELEVTQCSSRTVSGDGATLRGYEDHVVKIENRGRSAAREVQARVFLPETADSQIRAAGLAYTFEDATEWHVESMLLEATAYDLTLPLLPPGGSLLIYAPVELTPVLPRTGVLVASVSDEAGSYRSVESAATCNEIGALRI